MIMFDYHIVFMCESFKSLLGFEGFLRWKCFHDMNISDPQEMIVNDGSHLVPSGGEAALQLSKEADLCQIHLID